jgi:diguanylate cyclase (GGDEF)-like protein
MARVEKTVFISYRRTDFPWALAIYQHLTHHGFDVFFDYTGLASGDFASVIFENIRARAHFLIVLTPTALERCNEAEDWLRREIEESLDCRRNIVPLFMEGFDFGAPAIAPHLTGKLAALKRYNGVSVPDEYFHAAMEKLCAKFLNVPLEAVLHPASAPAREAAKEQRAAAFTDALTGLMNRREFENRLEIALKNTQRQSSLYALCYLDVDQFKLINGSCSHSAGDALLKQMAHLVRSKLRPEDTIARLGGDQFGILLEGVSLREAMRTAEALREEVRIAQFTWEHRSLHLEVSIGVVAISADNADIGSILTDVESACEDAKEAGRNRIHGFEENDVDRMRLRRQMQWAARINAALEEGRFELHRQLIVPLQKARSGAHVELLLRLRDEKGNVVSSEEFLAAAERYGISPRTDRWVIEHAFRWLKSEAAALEKVTLCSINLSGQTFGDEQFLSYLMDQFQRTGINASTICFEITETAIIARFPQATHFIETLKGLGCKFALDNFGSGLSSFGYLRQLPVDYLKIEGSFVREILHNPIDREMVRSLCEIGHLTGKQIIAEYAENAEVIQSLRLLGVDYAQGYGISPAKRVL